MKRQMTLEIISVNGVSEYIQRDHSKAILLSIKMSNEVSIPSIFNILESRNMFERTSDNVKIN